MADYAANFTSTLLDRPSILEVIAQKSLHNSLNPAFQKLALVLSTNFPAKFGWLNKYFEELFLALDTLLQFHYLAFYDASFSENFYGLKRILPNNEPLTNKQKELALIYLVVLPYFKRKLEEKIAIIRIERAEGSLGRDFESVLKKILLISHNIFEVVWGLYTIHNFVKYMAEKTQYPTPVYEILNCQLAYNKDIENFEGFWTSLFKGTLSFSQISFGLVRNAFSSTFELVAFFLQFLKAWNTQRPDFNVTGLPNVASPPLDSKSEKYKGKCPICLKSWAIPTVLQVSGYIFCFRCILRYLTEHQKCPVTNLPAKPLDIVRLYIT